MSLLLASLALALPFHGCQKRFTYPMGTRALGAVYHQSVPITRHERRMLGRIIRCQWKATNAERLKVLRTRQARARHARQHPALSHEQVSWYYDGTATASGFHATYGVADCGTGFGPGTNCYPFGTRVLFCYHGCVVATVDDHGPYVSGRGWDLGQSTAQAIGAEGVPVVGFHVY